MNPIAIATQGKGVLGTLKRAGTIQKRYGLTPQRMERTLNHFVNLLRDFKCGATFPITTSTLARSKGVVEKFQAENIEFSVHGYYHTDQTRLSFNQQIDQFLAARRLFAERGVRCEGFRSPYLRSNPEMLAALKQAGFHYDSSQGLAWEIPDELETHEYLRALEFYGAVSSQVYPALPRWDNDLVRIPYCLPDDEAFVDRFQASTERMTELWLNILENTYARGEVFTLALHPERIVLCQHALLNVLREAGKLRPQVWMTQLHQIVEWWKARTMAEVRVSQEADGQLCVSAHGVDGITLLARGVQPLSSVQQWDSAFIEAEGTELKFRSESRPFIGVSPASPAYLTSFLRQQGYIVETTATPQAADSPVRGGTRYGFYVDRSQFAYEDERPLLEEIEQGDFPLVRLGRWPHGARSALCVTGDIDALTIWDYALRIF